eukprot:gene42426-4589_t
MGLARMQHLSLGWRGIPYERTVYGYADWREGGARRLMDESVDIIQHIDGVGGVGNGFRLAPRTRRADLRRWRKRHNDLAYQLVRPRIVRMPIGDWATAADVAYQRAKYEAQGFDYDAA